MHRRSSLIARCAHRFRPFALAVVALGIVACVKVPDNMRAQFAPAGPNDRTNFRPGQHGSAPPNTPPAMLPWDAGTPVVAPASDDAGAPQTVPVRSAVDGGVG